MRHHHDHCCDDDDDDDLLRRLLCRALCCRPHHRKPIPIARITLRFGTLAVTFNGDFMNTLPDDKVGNAAVAYVDAKGNPAVVEGAPTWVGSDDNIATVVAAADGLSAVITPVNLGQMQVTITADADLGAGVTPVITIGDVEVVAGQAVAGNFSMAVA